MKYVAKALLIVETIVAFPVFVLAWFISAVWFAAKGGWLVASLSEEDKKKILEALGKKQ